MLRWMNKVASSSIGSSISPVSESRGHCSRASTVAGASSEAESVKGNWFANLSEAAPRLDIAERHLSQAIPAERAPRPGSGANRIAPCCDRIG